MAKFGLLGTSLGHSYSATFFTDFFQKESLPHSYVNVEVTVEQLKEVIEGNEFSGLNVTIPFKAEACKYVDELSDAAKACGALNTIVYSKGKTFGENTDIIGFDQSLPERDYKKALIVGNGGAAQAVRYVLEKREIPFHILTRSPNSEEHIAYFEIGRDGLDEYDLIVNCTPLGTYPNVDELPDLPYYSLTAETLLYDLVYNPEETAFMKEGKRQGLETINGQGMLKKQALAAWNLWKKTL